MNQPKKNIRDAVLVFIGEFTSEHGYPPSLGDISSACGLSGRSHAKYYADKLRLAGLINFEDGETRTITIIDNNVDKM